jgi:hypothetical protein
LFVPPVDGVGGSDASCVQGERRSPLTVTELKQNVATLGAVPDAIVSEPPLSRKLPVDSVYTVVVPYCSIMYETRCMSEKILSTL